MHSNGHLLCPFQTLSTSSLATYKTPIAPSAHESSCAQSRSLATLFTFILKDYLILSIAFESPTVNPKAQVKVLVLITNKGETIDIEARYIPGLMRSIAEKLSIYYNEDRERSRYRRYYVAHFADQMGL